MSWREDSSSPALVAGLIAFSLFVLSLLSSNDHGRMRDDEAINTYQISVRSCPRGPSPWAGASRP